MIPKDLPQVGPTDIQALIDGQVIEGRTLEFKRDMTISRDADKREFLADVSSFANTQGGDLVIGVECKDGMPTAIPGIEVGNADQLLQQINNLIRDGLEPRMPAPDAKFIPVGDARQALVLRIRQSWAAPHRVVFLKDRGFYARTSSGKYGLDVQELRAAFTQGPALVEELRRFREQRISWALSGQGAVSMVPGPLMLLHVIPIDGFVRRWSLDLSGPNPGMEISPMAVMGWNSRRNLDGLVRYSANAGKPNSSCVQLFATGVCEYAMAFGLDQAALPGRILQDRLIATLHKTCRYLRSEGAADRIVVFMSFHYVKNLELATGSHYGPNPSMGADRSDLLLPELIVESDQHISAATARPLLDSMWQSFGYDECPFP